MNRFKYYFDLKIESLNFFRIIVNYIKLMYKGGIILVELVVYVVLGLSRFFINLVGRIFFNYKINDNLLFNKNVLCGLSCFEERIKGVGNFVGLLFFEFCR